VDDQSAILNFIWAKFEKGPNEKVFCSNLPPKFNDGGPNSPDIVALRVICLSVRGKIAIVGRYVILEPHHARHIGRSRALDLPRPDTSDPLLRSKMHTEAVTPAAACRASVAKIVSSMMRGQVVAIRQF
jgi:hypothetical protein